MGDVYNNGSCVEHRADYPCKICFPTKPMGFDDDDLERFLVLLDQRQLSPLTTKLLVWQFKKQKAKLADALKKIAELELALARIQENALSYNPSACDISEIASTALGKHSV